MASCTQDSSPSGDGTASAVDPAAAEAASSAPPEHSPEQSPDQPPEQSSGGQSTVDDADAPDPAAATDPAHRAPTLSGEMTGPIVTDDGRRMHDSMPVELWVECDDPEAPAANRGHEPAGWPQEWDGEGAMPEPECHPDYIEVLAWEQFDAFTRCWEGPETSAFSDIDQFATEAERREGLWEQSRARAEWPGYEGTCAEQRAQRRQAEDGG